MWGKVWESVWGERGEVCWGVGEVRKEVGKGMWGVGEGKARCGGVKKCGRVYGGE